MNLINPQGNIDVFVKLWTPNSVDRMRLYENGNLININEYKKEFIGLSDIDEIILQIEDLQVCFSEINKHYHTRVSGIDVIIEVLQDKGIIKRSDLKNIIMNGELDLPNFVDLCKTATGQYTYSFASKVYSFLFPKDYPIIDSIVATLLAKYLDKEKTYKKEWGDYSAYKRDYDTFFSKYDLSDDYKYIKADMFLWTYGKILLKYWIDNGFMEYDGVSFDPKSVK